MKQHQVLTTGCLLSIPSALLAQATVPKTNPTPVYVQLMPWFQTPETLKGTNWGWHWTMNNQNPNVIEPNGQRDIASYYNPLIGPYDSSDPYVIEYQMLLMKLSGISGTIVDWYGEQGSNSDEQSLLNASNKIIPATQTYGLQVAAQLEDRFATSASEVTTNINYMEQNYATQSNYIKVGNAPLMPLFGPISSVDNTSTEWSSILSSVSQTPAIVPLQYQSSEVGVPPADGEMGWIYENSTVNYHTVQQNFVQYEAGNFSNSIGDAFVGYNDFYTAGGDPSAAAGFVIPESDSNGSTLTETLDEDETYAKNLGGGIQIATWNDYGEGTMIEPTVQNGFSSLQQVQQFTGVPYGLSQLQLVYQLYEAREQFLNNSTEETKLSQTSSDINNLDFPDALKTLADAITSTTATITSINTYTLNGTASLDLTNDQLIVTYSSSDPIAAVRAYLVSGFNNGGWNGLGIDSSYAAANHAYALGFADGKDGVVAGLSSGQIEIKYTLLGDANLDGVVNGTDFSILAANFGLGTTNWDQGNFLYGTTVNGSDFAALAANFGQGDSGGSSVTSGDRAALEAFAAANGLLADVPEPVALPALGIMAVLSVRRRSKKQALHP